MAESEISWLGAILTKRERDNSIVDVLSMKTEPASKVGDNYASVIVRATLKVVLGSGKVATKRIILKKALPDIPKEIAADMSGAFILEGLAYEKVLAHLEIMINEHNLPYSRFWPDCLYTSSNMIIFEDLRALGFTLGSRHNGLDLAHAKVAITNLARMHSLSVVAMADGSIFNKILPPYMMTELAVGEAFFRVSMNSLADVIRDMWDSDWADIENSIRFLTKQIIPILKKLYTDPHKLNVINHGDCWVNNMMFKYNDDGSPVDHMFVDLQLCHCNSYAWDLTYFLHSSIHPKTLESCQDSLVEIYSKEFSVNLERLGFDISIAPTVDEINYELDRLLPFSIAVATSILPVTANPSDIKISLEEMLSDESTKFRELFENKEFSLTIQSMLRRLIKQGAFSKIN